MRFVDDGVDLLCGDAPGFQLAEVRFELIAVLAIPLGHRLRRDELPDVVLGAQSEDSFEAINS
eukprot:178027-Pyramimonas_sp.AAC.1